jgi:hypothetical protein
LGGPIGNIFLALRDGRIIGSDHDSRILSPVPVHSANFDDIIERHWDHQRIEQMVTVSPPAENSQE